MTAAISTCQEEKIMLDLLVQALVDSPSEDWLTTIANENIFESAPYAENQADVQAALGILQKWAQEYRDNGAEKGAVEQNDYMNLLIGIAKPLAPPWESVFLSDEALLFQEQTLEVRQWYKAYGLQSRKLYSEPDDHIALELEFLSHLTNLVLEADNSGDSDEVKKLLEARSDFFSKHLLLWAFDWCIMVGEHARGDFYKGIALLVSGTLHELAGT